MTMRTLRVLVASVWLVHGLYNKLLGGSPRHLAIVQSVPGFAGAAGVRMLTAVGIFEVAIAIWILSGRWARRCAATQTAALLSMNLVELTFAKQLLLWPAGLLPLNIVFLTLAWVAAGARWPARLRARLRRHPIPIEAHFDNCLTLVYALPAAVLRPLVPHGLELDTFGGYGFVAIAMVQTRSLRAAGLPKYLGRDFFLAGYRVFVRFHTDDGKTLRGLRILRSDADRGSMVTGGNLLTHYNYRRCEAGIEPTAHAVHVSVSTPDGMGDLDVTAHLTTRALPGGTPFLTLRDAQRFAGPLPFTFDFEPETNSIVAIHARRTAWRPAPIAVDVRRLGFFDQPRFKGCTPVLAAAFHVADVDYRWERGVRHALTGRVGEAA
jgi:uncharacterized membrane protein YphA (DoxX/SURF4 family)